MCDTETQHSHLKIFSFLSKIKFYCCVPCTWVEHRFDGHEKYGVHVERPVFLHFHIHAWKAFLKEASELDSDNAPPTCPPPKQLKTELSTKMVVRTIPETKQ